MLDPCFWQMTAVIDHQTPQKIDSEAKMRESVHFTLFLQCHTYQLRPQDFVWCHAILVQFTVGCDLWQTYDRKTTVVTVTMQESGPILQSILKLILDFRIGQNRPESTHAVTILISTLDSGSPLAGCEFHLSIYIILHLFHSLPLCLPGHVVLHECCSYSGCIRVLKRQIFVASKNANTDFDS